MTKKGVKIMEKTYSPKPFNTPIDYYPLPNGKADVFLYRNQTVEVGEEGEEQYVVDKVYFQVEQSTTKEYIEENFEIYWENKGRIIINKPTLEERIEVLEMLELERIFGGI